MRRGIAFAVAGGVVAVLLILFGYLVSAHDASSDQKTPATATDCTKIAVAGADLSTFLGTLVPGDVGCLHGGEYTDGCNVSWGGSSETLRSYPGEHAIVHTMLTLNGKGLKVHGLEVTIPASCGTSTSGFSVQGTSDVVEFNYIHDVPRHGILTGTSSSNVTIYGNFIRTVGTTCNLDHGVYFQTSGRIIRNVFSDARCGYGMQIYPAAHDVIVAENTSVGSRVRSGIVLETSGNNVRVVNNIFASNAVAGMTLRSCGTGCLIDNNITWNNTGGSCQGDLCSAATNTRNVDPLFTDTGFRVSAGSPAVDTARADYAFVPDLDGVQAFQGVGPDLGAYER